jgi:hypothetical protein
MRTLQTLPSYARKVSLAKWLRHAFNNPTQMSDDVHLDQLSHHWGKVRNGLQWLAPCCHALREVVHLATVLDNLVGVQKAIVALPLDESQRIKTWKDSYWRLAGVQTEPPSLILLKDDSFANRYDEEYFRKLELPIDDAADVSAVFRSYRDLNSERIDGFGNAIFLVMCIS